MRHITRLLNLAPSNHFYFFGGQGLGDRMECISTMLALRDTGLDINIFWKQNSKHLPVPFEDLFLPYPGVTTLNRNWVPSLRGALQLEAFRPFLFRKSFMPELYKLNYPDNIIHKIQRLGEQQLRFHSVRKARQMKPVEWISNAVESFSRQHFSEDMVGLHIRKTDKIDRISEGQYGGIEKHRQLLREMEDELEKSIRAGKKIFLCSDNRDSILQYTRKIKTLGGKVVHYKKEYNPDQFRQTSGADALIDMLLLSKCRLSLGTRSDFRFMATCILGTGNRYWNGNTVDIIDAYKNQSFIDSFIV